MAITSVSDTIPTAHQIKIAEKLGIKNADDLDRDELTAAIFRRHRHPTAYQQAGLELSDIVAACDPDGDIEAILAQA